MKLSKVFLIVLCTTALFGAFTTTYASGNQIPKTMTQIPATMPPGTLLYFDENGNCTVVEEGKVMPRTRRGANPNNESTEGLEEENLFVEKVLEEAKKYPTYVIKSDYDVTPNTYVKYGSDGEINRIYREDEKDEKIDARYSPLPRGTRKSAGTYTYGSSSNNTITISSGAVLGEGRLSTFGELPSDAIGENGKEDPNKAGDCATKGEIDNPPYHQPIQVRDLDSDISKTLRKNDNGNLPNAILDIYKWSGIMFGQSWYDGFTFENGRYYFTF